VTYFIELPCRYICADSMFEYFSPLMMWRDSDNDNGK